MRRPTWTIEWNDGMSVGIPEIDEDHKHFILLINEFNRSITDRRDTAEIKTRLQNITADAAQHFAHEEKLLKEWQYPDIDVHARIHLYIMKELLAIKEQFSPYALDSGWVDAGLRIKGLLLDHILTEDMKYAELNRNSSNAYGQEKINTHRISESLGIKPLINQ